MKIYTEENATPLLAGLPDWKFRNSGIEKEFVFKNFVEAMGFLMQLAIVSEKASHHAEIFNVYNQVKIRLSTHDASGVTEKDFQLATEIEKLL